MKESLTHIISEDNVEKLKDYIKENPSDDLSEALCDATRSGKLNIVKFLIENQKLAPTATATIIEEGRLFRREIGPAFKLVEESGNLELVKYFYDFHLDVTLGETQVSHGQPDTALSRAAKYGHPKIVSYLISKGANPNYNNYWGSILEKGVTSGNLEVVQILVAKGAEITKQEMYYALKYGHLEIVKFFISEGVDPKETYIGSSIQVAIESGNVELVKYLQHEIHLNLVEPERFYADKDVAHKLLCIAAKNGKLEMMRYLVEECHLKLDEYVIKENLTKCI